MHKYYEKQNMSPPLSCSLSLAIVITIKVIPNHNMKGNFWLYSSEIRNKRNSICRYLYSLLSNSIQFKLLYSTEEIRKSI